MFPVFTNDEALNVLKELYCHSNFENCERYRTFKSGVIPSKALLPDGRMLK